MGRASVLHVGGYGFESRRLQYQYVTEWLTCPLWEREIEGSNPSVLIIILVSLAQWIEWWFSKPSDIGSNPIGHDLGCIAQW